jgi:hypothetical protein
LTKSWDLIGWKNEFPNIPEYYKRDKRIGKMEMNEKTTSKVVLSPESPGRRSSDPHKSLLKRYSQSSVKGQSTVARSGLGNLNKKKRRCY